MKKERDDVALFWVKANRHSGVKHANSISHEKILVKDV